MAEGQLTPKPATPSAQAKAELKDAVMEDAKAKDEAVTAGADDEDSSGDEEGDGEFVAASSYR